MIDTDKYEGHQPANLWGREIVAEEKRKIFLNTAWLSSIGNDVYSNEKDRLLMADAPLLLAEVKRLRGVIYDALYVLQTDGWNKNRADAINRLEKILIKGWEGEEE